MHNAVSRYFAVTNKHEYFQFGIQYVSCFVNNEPHILFCFPVEYTFLRVTRSKYGMGIQEQANSRNVHVELVKKSVLNMLKS